MCDSDPVSIDYFQKHLQYMQNDLAIQTDYLNVDNVADFFNTLGDGEQ